MKKGNKKKRAGRIALLILLLFALAAGILLAAVKFHAFRSLLGWLDKTAAPKEAVADSVDLPENAVHPQRRSITAAAEGNGTLEAAQQWTATAPFSIRIEKVYAQTGDLVQAGDLIASVEPDSIGEQLELVRQELSDVNSSISNLSKGGSEVLSAPVAGRVKRIFVSSGDRLDTAVAEFGGVMELEPTGRLTVTFSAETEAAGGDTVTEAASEDTVTEAASEDTVTEAATGDIVTELAPGDTVTVTGQNATETGTVLTVRNGSCTAEFSDSAAWQVGTAADVTASDGTYLGNGLVACSHSYLVDAGYGTAGEIRVAVGDWVEAGNTLMTRRNYTYNAEYLDLLESREKLISRRTELLALEKDPRLTAGETGILSSLSLTDAAALTEHEPMYTVSLTDSYFLNVKIDEYEIAGVSEGQKAFARFESFQDARYEGTVGRISGLGENTNGVTAYDVTITLPGSLELKTGMNAAVTIITAEKEDALVIPVDAVHTENGRRMVTVLRDGKEEEREVTLGIVTHTLAEVTEGLSEEEVVLAGSTFTSLTEEDVLDLTSVF